ncbi:MAG: hypothetical protein WD894_22550 [Pirellulales bacterium]
MNLEPQLFIGDASDAEARVYATLPRAGLADDAQLIGELIGPHCRYSKTLPARIRFVDRGPGPTLLAEAVVPDPCFWTPELPFMYSVELRLAGAVAAENEIAPAPPAMRRPFGIRRLGVHGTSIYLDAKRFVLRGVHLDAPKIEDLKAAREAASALYIEEPSEAFLQEASEEGVLLVVRLGEMGAQGKLAMELARLGRWPAVAIAVLNDEVPAGKEIRLSARSMLLAQRLNSGAATPPASIAPWAHVLWWEIGPTESAIVQPPHMPVVAYRPTAEPAAIAQRRRNCDHLQADLAPLGDFAGYFT